MKLYNSIGPNPQVVRMFLAEKGVELPTETVDLLAGENRQGGYLARNPHGQTPCLELDNGAYLSEILPICEYIEEKHPSPPLIGDTAEKRAETRMWTRRIDLNIIEPMTNAFRFSAGLPLFKDRIVCAPEAAPGLQKIAADRLKWLDGQMAGKQYVCGDRFTLADVHLYCFLTFGIAQKVASAEGLPNITAWLERVGKRPSAKA